MILTNHLTAKHQKQYSNGRIKHLLAKLEITVQINTDQIDELIHQGYSAGMLQQEIKKDHNSHAEPPEETC